MLWLGSPAHIDVGSSKRNLLIHFKSISHKHKIFPIPQQIIKSTSSPYFRIISTPFDMKKLAKPNATFRIARIPSNLIQNWKTNVKSNQFCRGMKKQRWGRASKHAKGANARWRITAYHTILNISKLTYCFPPNSLLHAETRSSSGSRTTLIRYELVAVQWFGMFWSGFYFFRSGLSPVRVVIFPVRSDLVWVSKQIRSRISPP